MAGGSKSLVLGFMDVRRESSDAFRAGYLLTTDYGRPIEFHYTTAVSVPKSHQILYGPDFEPVFFSEHLAKPMTDRQSSAPQLVAVGTPALLRLRMSIPAPVVHLARPVKEGPIVATANSAYPKDQTIFEKVAGMVPPGFDWMELFDRLQGALAEVKETPAPLLVA